MKPGAHLGPYEIVAPLGAGGMGEVWRARDTRLGRDVAIKVLPADVGADPDRLARFEREARALAVLSHPNILGIHDFGREGEVTYAAVELLEGETLRERLRRERLPWRKAVEIVAAIADGLAAAHSKGIVHRDIKPENVFLTADGRVKVLDFGLARLVAAPLGAEQTLTSPPPGTWAGTVLGTVGYMAPEQVRGEPADARSDIFALGCVFHEALSGKHPFTRNTAAETMTAILREPAPDVPSSGAAVAPELSRVVGHCLEKQPGERFQSASDAAFALRSLLTASAAPVSTPKRRRSRLRVAAVAVVALGGAAAALFVWSPWRTRPDANALDPRRVVVAVFENRTGDPSLDPLGRMASDWITQGLSQIASIETVPTAATIDAEQATRRDDGSRRRTDLLRALAEETGAGVVVSGAFYLQGSGLQVQARVTDASRGALIHAVEPISGPRDAPMQAIDVLRQRVLGVIAAHYEPTSSLHTALSPPPLYDAYREYVAGLELFGEDYPQAIRHFERAAAIDPAFASPQLYTAVAYSNQGDHERADAIVRRVNESRERLSPLQRHMMDWLRARLAGRDAEALQAIRRAQKLVSRSATVNYVVALECRDLNLPQQAVENLSKLTPDAIRGSNSVTGSWRYIVLTQAHHMLADYERELQAAEEAIRAFPDILTARHAKVRALVALGRLDEVSRLIDDSLAVRSRAGTPGGLMVQGALELHAHGHREEALRMAARAADWLRGRPPSEQAREGHRSALAGALYAGERWDEARAIYEALAEAHPVGGGGRGSAEAQGAGEPESLRLSRAIDYLAALGTLAARRGDRDEAVRISDQLARIEAPFLFGRPVYGRACIAALLGEEQQAVDHLRESFAQGNAYDVNLHCDMDLEPLRGYPPFVELLRPKG